MLDKLRSMRVEAKGWPALLLPTFFLSMVVLGMGLAGRAAPQPPGSRTPVTPGPEVLALAPEAPLPPSVPPFSPPGPDLAGRVVSAQGDPVAGARVFIDAAKPRVGRGYT